MKLNRYDGAKRDGDTEIQNWLFQFEWVKAQFRVKGNEMTDAEKNKIHIRHFKNHHKT